MIPPSGDPPGDPPEPILAAVYGFYPLVAPSTWPAVLAAIAAFVGRGRGYPDGTAGGPSHTLIAHRDPSSPEAGCGLSIALRDGTTGASALTLDLSGPPASGDLGPEAERRLAALTPHLRRAIAIVAAAAARGPDLATWAALDGFATGLMICGRDGGILFANRVAQSLAADQHGLAIRNGRMVILDPRAAERFAAALELATGSAPGPEDGRPQEFTAPRRAGGPPLVFVVTPLRSGSDLLDALAPPRACVYLLDGQLGGADPEALDRLRRQYGLTASEAAIAGALICGQTVQEIATLRGVSIATIRTQVKVVLEKTQSSGQADLFRLQGLLQARIDRPPHT